MSNSKKFYIDGEWILPKGTGELKVVNPATEEEVASISLGNSEDVDRAVAAARSAFASFSRTSRQERLQLLKNIIAEFHARSEDMAQAMTLEMGAPITFSRQTQIKMAVGHFEQLIKILPEYKFERMLDDIVIRREPIGVCGLITPWNWPLNQITSKLAPILATGSTAVVKPSEFSPLSALILAEVMDAAGVPKGVFNLVNGTGEAVGAAMSGHAGIDMISFTGSTRAGILIARNAAGTVKRVAQELGGKSANLVLPDADLESAVSYCVRRAFANSGQSCQGPTRLLVHTSQVAEAEKIAEATATGIRIGDTLDPKTEMGPLVNSIQFDRVQDYIGRGIAENAVLICGGLGRPEGFNRGFFVRPTVFSQVEPEMAIAREEIFGPVLSILAYETEQQAIDIANDTPYGLAGYVQSGDIGRARSVAEQLRAGRIYINQAPADQRAPFGGYKQSGNGREQGEFGMDEVLEMKAILGGAA